jgi:DnaJ-class molecular chaperone
MAKDPYGVLGVARDASDADIQKAFRKQAKKFHPDLNPGDKKAEDRFKEINAAYDIVGDAAKRARFDRGEIDATGAEIRQNPFAGGFRGGRGAGMGGGPGAGGGQGFAFEDLSDIFGGIFGGGGPQGGGFRHGPMQGQDLRFQLEVDFLDAARGAKKRLTLPSGKALEVTIPAGIASGQAIRLKGQGEPGPGKPGDALIEIAVREHAFYRRDGNDIRIDLPVTLQEAVLGAKVQVPTIHGPVTVTVPKGANSGTTLRLKGKGIAAGKTAAGDQYVTLKVVLPPGGNAELEQFARTWGAKHSYNPRAELENG